MERKEISKKIKKNVVCKTGEYTNLKIKKVYHDTATNIVAGKTLIWIAKEYYINNQKECNERKSMSEFLNDTYIPYSIDEKVKEEEEKLQNRVNKSVDKVTNPFKRMKNFLKNLLKKEKVPMLNQASEESTLGIVDEEIISSQKNSLNRNDFIQSLQNNRLAMAQVAATIEKDEETVVEKEITDDIER